MAALTVAIPTYNRREMLERAVESVLAQTCGDFELLILDNASTDGTADYLGKLRDPRVRIHHEERTIPAVENWTNCFMLARSPLVSWLSDDDWYKPNFVEQYLAAFERHPDASAVFGQYELVDEHGKILKTQNADWQAERVLRGADLLDAALSRRWFISATVYRTDVIREVWADAKQDGKVADYASTVRMGVRDRDKVVYIPRNDYCILGHEGQMSQTCNREVLDASITALERVLPLQPRYRRMISWEIAQTHIRQGRALLKTDRRGARVRFRQAISAAPTLRFGWSQYVLSFVK